MLASYVQRAGFACKTARPTWRTEFLRGFTAVSSVCRWMTWTSWSICKLQPNCCLQQKWQLSYSATVWCTCLTHRCWVLVKQLRNTYVVLYVVVTLTILAQKDLGWACLALVDNSQCCHPLRWTDWGNQCPADWCFWRLGCRCILIHERRPADQGAASLQHKPRFPLVKSVDMQAITNSQTHHTFVLRCLFGILGLDIVHMRKTKPWLSSASIQQKVLPPATGTSNTLWT